jgi:hypothetical protein
VSLPGDQGSREFNVAYFKALYEGVPSALAARPMPQTFDMRHKQAVERALKKSLSGCKARATARGRQFDLTLDWVIEQIERQGFRCALTGIPFFSKNTSKSARDPYAPSFDRINSLGGYTKDNVRVIVFALNVMLLDWGDAVFEHILNCYRGNKTRRADVANLQFGSATRKTKSTESMV